VSGVTSCVIPSLNVGASVAGVVRGLRESLPGAVIIGVDDGSTDDTPAILAATCDEVLVLDRNRGKGAALRAGFAAALAMESGTIVTIDADGQHDPAYAPSLVSRLDEADVVVGARSRSAAGMPLQRRLTNALSTAAMRRIASCDLADVQSGFRAFRAEVLRAIQARGDRYEFETDLLLRCARAGLRIVTVPIPTIYGPASHFRGMRDGWRVVATFWDHAHGGAAE
jgi:glycosyltransferase involved in cell wall biosynthesis